MGTITVKYKNKKQLSTLKKVLEALEFDFEENFPPYKNPSPSGDTWWDEPKNMENVLQGIKDIKAGRSKEFSLEELKELMKIDEL